MRTFWIIIIILVVAAGIYWYMKKKKAQSAAAVVKNPGLVSNPAGLSITPRTGRPQFNGYVAPTDNTAQPINIFTKPPVHPIWGIFN